MKMKWFGSAAVGCLFMSALVGADDGSDDEAKEETLWGGGGTGGGASSSSHGERTEGWR